MPFHFNRERSETVIARQVPSMHLTAGQPPLPSERFTALPGASTTVWTQRGATAHVPLRP